MNRRESILAAALALCLLLVNHPPPPCRLTKSPLRADRPPSGGSAARRVLEQSPSSTPTTPADVRESSEARRLHPARPTRGSIA